ncbi:hypothetical protein AVEN_197472-1 [Araneus ventricosus]|uniref:Uncharacterized protein n=1 Tax=Araneus ventricosus TaxID=182803 RepID=A0A4Y2VFT4_ARAVE|nr:hypothetical protein AVEN_197472-1 [Araneus ventricosus]
MSNEPHRSNCAIHCKSCQKKRDATPQHSVRRLIYVQCQSWLLAVSSVDSLVSVQLRRDIHHSFLIGSVPKGFCVPSVTRYGVKRSSSYEFSCGVLPTGPGGYFGGADFSSCSGIFTAPPTKRGISGPKGSTILHR